MTRRSQASRRWQETWRCSRCTPGPVATCPRRPARVPATPRAAAALAARQAARPVLRAARADKGKAGFEMRQAAHLLRAKPPKWSKCSDRVPGSEATAQLVPAPSLTVPQPGTATMNAQATQSCLATQADQMSDAGRPEKGVWISQFKGPDTISGPGRAVGR